MRLRHVALLLHEQSKYGVLSAMTEDLASALERAGIRVSVLRHVDAESIPQEVERLAPDCTWAVNISVSEHLGLYPFGTPHVTLSVDSLLHFLPAAFERSHSVWLFVDSQSHELFQSKGGKRSHWFPHAIAQETVERALSEEPIPLSARPYDISLPGSYGEYRSSLASLQVDPATRRRLLDIVRRALAGLSFPLLAEGFLVAEQQGLDPVTVGQALELAVRGLDRERLIQGLSGRTINIFTTEEDAELWRREESARACLFHPAFNFRGLFDLCRRSKVVLNSAPHIRCGYHERLFLSLASGAITVTERGRVPQWLVERGRVVEYDTASLDTLAERVREAEGLPYDREGVLKWLAREHTWDARLRTIVPAIEQDLYELKKEWKRSV
jgi:hypothetical protein